MGLTSRCPVPLVVFLFSLCLVEAGLAVSVASGSIVTSHRSFHCSGPESTSSPGWTFSVTRFLGGILQFRPLESHFSYLTPLLLTSRYCEMYPWHWSLGYIHGSGWGLVSSVRINTYFLSCLNGALTILQSTYLYFPGSPSIEVRLGISMSRSRLIISSTMYTSLCSTFCAQYAISMCFISTLSIVRCLES